MAENRDIFTFVGTPSPEDRSKRPHQERPPAQPLVTEPQPLRPLLRSSHERYFAARSLLLAPDAVPAVSARLAAAAVAASASLTRARAPAPLVPVVLPSQAQDGSGDASPPRATTAGPGPARGSLRRQHPVPASSISASLPPAAATYIAHLRAQNHALALASTAARRALANVAQRTHAVAAAARQREALLALCREEHAAASLAAKEASAAAEAEIASLRAMLAAEQQAHAETRLRLLRLQAPTAVLSSIGGMTDDSDDALSPRAPTPPLLPPPPLPAFSALGAEPPSPITTTRAPLSRPLLPLPQPLPVPTISTTPASAVRAALGEAAAVRAAALVHESALAAALAEAEERADAAEERAEIAEASLAATANALPSKDTATPPRQRTRLPMGVPAAPSRGSARATGGANGRGKGLGQTRGGMATGETAAGGAAAAIPSLPTLETPPPCPGAGAPMRSDSSSSTGSSGSSGKSSDLEETLPLTPPRPVPGSSTGLGGQVPWEPLLFGTLTPSPAAGDELEQARATLYAATPSSSLQGVAARARSRSGDSLESGAVDAAVVRRLDCELATATSTDSAEEAASSSVDEDHSESSSEGTAADTEASPQPSRLPKGCTSYDTAAVAAAADAAARAAAAAAMALAPAVAALAAGSGSNGAEAAADAAAEDAAAVASWLAVSTPVRERRAAELDHWLARTDAGSTATAAAAASDAAAAAASSSSLRGMAPVSEENEEDDAESTAALEADSWLALLAAETDASDGSGNGAQAARERADRLDGWLAATLAALQSASSSRGSEVGGSAHPARSQLQRHTTAVRGPGTPAAGVVMGGERGRAQTVADSRKPALPVMTTARTKQPPQLQAQPQRGTLRARPLPPSSTTAAHRPITSTGANVTARRTRSAAAHDAGAAINADTKQTGQQQSPPGIENKGSVRQRTGPTRRGT